jgi:hypothetical protein
MPPRKKKRRKTRHCKNCSQPVRGKLAKVAADPEVVFCCHCGVQLIASGKCQNELCPFFQAKPICA